MLSHVDHYMQLYGSSLRIYELNHILSYTEDCSPNDRWMTMIDMGHLVSPRYNIILYHLSSEQCITCLPLRSIPLPTLARREIAISFVNGNQFVQVLSNHGCIKLLSFNILSKIRVVSVGFLGIESQHFAHSF